MVLQEIDTADVARMIAALEERDLSPRTVRGALEGLTRVFRFAIRHKYINDNPVSRLEKDEKPSVDDGEQRIPSTEELRRLIEASSRASRPLNSTIAMTGLRQGEALGLGWDDVDFEAGLVRVRYQLGRNGKRARLKTAAARRNVILIPGLAEVLHRHRKEAFSRGDTSAQPYVFSTKSGRPWSHRNAARALSNAARKAGLGEGISTHGLRHTFVSFLILELGFDVHRVAHQVGHTKPSFTLDTYTHLFEQANHAEATRERIAASDFGRVLER